MNESPAWPRRWWPLLVCAVASAALVTAWAVVISTPDQHDMGDTAYAVWNWAVVVSTLGGLLSMITSWFLPTAKGKVACFLASGLIVFASFSTIGALV